MPKFNVMGERPGDGGTYEAENHLEAFVQHCVADGADPECVRAYMKKEFADFVDPFTKSVVFGDYTVIRLSV